MTQSDFKNAPYTFSLLGRKTRDRVLPCLLLPFLLLSCAEDNNGGSDNQRPPATGGKSGAGGSGTTGNGGAGTANNGGAPGGAGTPAMTLQWYTTCGDPVCGPNPSAPGVPACSAGAAAGESCVTADERCDANLGCGATLVCSASDPKLSPGGCPISRAKFKTEIEYVSKTQRAQLAKQLLDVPLATYQYRADKSATRQLGFIIEDLEPSPSVYSEQDKVNLYGYTSMVVAAVQEQQAELEQLRQQLDQLRATCAPAKATSQSKK